MDFRWYFLLPPNFLESFVIFLFGLTICIVFTILGAYSKHRSTLLWNIAGILWVIYLGFVIVSYTVIDRSRASDPKIQLNLFWCIKEAWSNKDIFDWYLIVANIALFVPFGFVVACFFDKLRSWWKVVLCGFIVSFLVEGLQLLLHVGLFELDDLFHNTLGAYMGYCLFMLGLFVKKKDSRKHIWKNALVSCISWIILVGFFLMAMAMGQPVFGVF